MKKIMIAAASVCAAAFANAASCSWTTDYTMVTGESEERSGNIAYTWAIVTSATSDFSGYSFDSGVVTGGSAVNTGSSSVALYGGSEGTFGGTAGQYYALMVHTDENGGYWGISTGIKAAEDTSDPSGATLLPMSFSNAKDVFGYDQNAMVANIADIPEPTSGLLLLLGMAGLALRRRRA